MIHLNFVSDVATIIEYSYRLIEPTTASDVAPPRHHRVTHSPDVVVYLGDSLNIDVVQNSLPRVAFSLLLNGLVSLLVLLQVKLSKLITFLLVVLHELLHLKTA